MTETAEPPRDGRAEALLRATPDPWAGAMPPVVYGGSAVAPLLLQGPQPQPDADGAQAAIAVLGQIGDDAATPFLMAQVEQRGETAAEAALAHGARQTTPAVGVLMATMQDHLADDTLRTACACALAALNDNRAAAPFVHAVPPQRALRSVGGNDFGLHPDLPWPKLQVVAAQIVAHLEGR